MEIETAISKLGEITRKRTKSVNLSNEQREFAKSITADLMVKGWSNYAVAKLLRDNDFYITHTTINTYYNEILDEWRLERVGKVDDLFDMLIIEIKGYDRVEKEAWQAWEQSKKSKNKTTKRKVGKPSASEGIITRQLEETVEDSEQDGNPKFLEIINTCREKRSLLLLKLYGNPAETGDATTNTTYVQQNIQVNVVERRKPISEAEIQSFIS